MKSVSMLLLAVFFGATTWASGRNLVSCNGVNSIGAPQNVVIHQDVGGQIVALFSTESTGDSFPTLPFKVQYIPAKPGQLGAGLNYAGSNFSLHVNTDGPGSPFAGSFTLKSFRLYNQKVSCTLN